LDPKALQAVANFVPRRIAFREIEDLTADLVSRAVAASSRALEQVDGGDIAENVA
jgi:1-deoxy-D-xylulose 5-phosphate reductoisomerase